MGIELSSATEERLNLLFPEPERADVREILMAECGSNLPFCENATSESCERIRFAVLKLSEGNIKGLKKAVEIAKQDWRDVLVAAGFANSVTAHTQWWPETLRD